MPAPASRIAPAAPDAATPHRPARRPTLGEILLLGSLTAFGAVSTDMYLPALPAIARDLGASPASVQLTLSVFFAGVASGQLVLGPLSDRLGRRPVLIGGGIVYVLASLFVALAPGIEGLIAGRFVQAIGSCAGMVVGRAVVRDRYDTRESARIFSFLTLVLAVAPLCAPTIGGWVAAVWGWRAIFAIFVAFGLAMTLAVALRLEESRSAATAATAAGESVPRAYRALLGHRRLVGYMLVSAMHGCTLFTYIAAVPDLVLNVWGFAPERFGPIFAVVAVGVIGASQINRRLLLRRGPDRILAVAGIVAALCGLGLLALVLAGAPPLAVLAGLFALLSAGGFIGSNALAGALGVDPSRAGATSGLFGAFGFACGAGASALAAALHDGTARPMAAIMAVAPLLGTLAFFTLARPR